MNIREQEPLPTTLIVVNDIMKNRLTIFSGIGIAGGIALCGFTVALAIEPPPDESKPPSALLGKSQVTPLGKTPTPPTEATAFVGIATAAVPSMVSDHLGLPAGSGVIIRTVCPNSPAEKAGLSVNDIITAVGDEPVTSPDQFSTTISNSEIGERLALELIHRGNPSKIELTLTERPADLASGVLQEPFLDGLPKAHADRLRGLLEQNLQSFGAGGFRSIDDSNFENEIEQMHEQLRNGFDNSSSDSAGFNQNSTIRFMDQDGSIELKSMNGSTHVTVLDTANNPVWEGPWTTEEDKTAAPKGIRERIDNVGAGKGFNFRFGNLGN